VLEHGGNEDQAIGGLLHDALEDQRHKVSAAEIRKRFGHRVARIVESCTDGEPDEKRDKSLGKWQLRKQRYIRGIAKKSADAVLVSMADKLYNARSIIEDFREKREELWSRFNGGKEGTLWYYQELLKAFEAHGKSRLWRDLERTVAQLVSLSHSKTSPARARGNK